MINTVKSFLKEEDGIGVVEILLILAVIVGIALVFREKIVEFVQSLLKAIFGDTGEETINELNKDIDPFD